MIYPTPFGLGFAAVVVAACAAVAGGLGIGPSAAETAQVAEGTSLPFACSLVARAQSGGTDLEAVLQAREAISASYALTVRGPGIAIDQGGDLTLGAGETTTLGQASVSGTASSLDATLTVTVGGQTYTCPLQES
jgi:hypothetical protein